MQNQPFLGGGWMWMTFSRAEPELILKPIHHTRGKPASRLRQRRYFPMFKKGDFVKINKDIGVVVLTGKELEGDNEDHTGVWFGTYEKGLPEMWIIPTGYLEK